MPKRLHHAKAVKVRRDLWVDQRQWSERGQYMFVTLLNWRRKNMPHNWNQLKKQLFLKSGRNFDANFNGIESWIGPERNSSLKHIFCTSIKKKKRHVEWMCIGRKNKTCSCISNDHQLSSLNHVREIHILHFKSDNYLFMHALADSWIF